MSLRIPRRQYADLYGPTTGDRIRLADTDLLIRIERDFTVAGEEVKFGGGKVIRDGMGQSARATRADATLACMTDVAGTDELERLREENERLKRRVARRVRLRSASSGFLLVLGCGLAVLSLLALSARLISW